MIVVGIPTCTQRRDRIIQHAAPRIYGEALIAVAGALPVLLPSLGEAMLGILDRLDGLLLDGSPSNVEPRRYGVEHDATPNFHDPARDDTTLPLIRAAIARGMPLLAICRGIQELNVALGGTLHQQVHTVPGRHDHREPGGTAEEAFALRHWASVSGSLARIVGSDRLFINSLHGQAIDQLAPGLVVEALAEDGTIEAVRVTECRGFAMGVQFHPEWHARTDPSHAAIFRAFGDACRAYAAGRPYLSAPSAAAA
jgi:putative glutamine amidotransferase